MLQNKVCTKCKVEKNISEFNNHSGNPDGLQSNCRLCNRNRARERYRANKQDVQHRQREQRLLREYGITIAEYDALVEEQDNTCAICDIEFSKINKKDIHIDHCHSTGMVRGILCHWCNLGLGMFRDNKTNLERAILYLK